MQLHVPYTDKNVLLQQQAREFTYHERVLRYTDAHNFHLPNTRKNLPTTQETLDPLSRMYPSNTHELYIRASSDSARKRPEDGTTTH